MRELICNMANTNIGGLCIFLKNKKNIEYLNFIKDNIPNAIHNRKLSEMVYYFVNNIKDILLCDCGKHLSFIGFKSGYRTSCGNKKCYVNNRKKTCINRFGVDNPKKSKEILDKEKKNILNKWGGKHYMMSNAVRNKFKSTMLDRYGVEWAQQSKEISNKSVDTFFNNPNKSEIIRKRSLSLVNKSDSEKVKINAKKINTIIDNWGSVDLFYKNIVNKTRERALLNYGVHHHLSHDYIIKKRIDKYKQTITNKIVDNLPSNVEYIDRKMNKTNSDSLITLKCNECKSVFDISRQYLKFRINSNDKICIICNPILYGKSKMELDVLNFIKTHYNGDVLTNIKNIIGCELDIYLPDIKLAFEFNGLYWHSDIHKDNKYHQNKTKECSEFSISLMHIWEDDWLYKQDIVKSIILNKLGKSKRIFARKCKVIEITDNKIVRNFLDKNHIQGFVGSKIRLGLFYNNELVSLMTFGSLRKSLGQSSKEGSYELLRFCNLLNTSVIGGASKLFKYFIKNYNVKEIISYSDNSRGIGNLYKQLGFKFQHETDPNYYWIVDGLRKHRFNFRKDKLVSLGYDKNKTEVEIMNGLGYNRIFDCGSKKWIYINR
jgi:hypothetical protein